MDSIPADPDWIRERWGGLRLEIKVDIWIDDDPRKCAMGH